MLQTQLINNKYETEELLSKVLELEEKRRTINSLVNLEQIKGITESSSSHHDSDTGCRVYGVGVHHITVGFRA